MISHDDMELVATTLIALAFIWSLRWDRDRR
jgi:hypothetical protein